MPTTEEYDDDSDDDDDDDDGGGGDEDDDGLKAVALDALISKKVFAAFSLNILFKMSPTAVNVLLHSAQLPEAGWLSIFSSSSFFFQLNLSRFVPDLLIA